MPHHLTSRFGVPMTYDAVVVGGGPNGLAAAVTLAEAGRSVVVVEAAHAVGGGARSAELTLPGFVHDVCSAVHPLAAVSPFFAATPLARHGLDLVHPELPLVHPLDGGRAGVLHRSVEVTADGLGADAQAWRRLVGWPAAHWGQLAPQVLGPVLRPPRHPLALARFGLRALPPATWAIRRFSTEQAAALFVGAAAHAFLPLSRPLTSSFGVMLLASGHVAGWPFARGGSQRIVDAMAARLVELGGEIRTGRPVRTPGDLPAARAVLADLTPRQVVAIWGDSMPGRYRRRLERYRYGPAAFKIDYALSEPVPWTNEAARRAGTVHVGGTVAEVAAAEADAFAGRHHDRPFVLVAQPTLVDPSRAPHGRHTLWVYAHVPHASTVDATEAIEAQIERFAPGFRDVVLARHVASPAWFESYNENNVGGDIAGGSHEALQLLFRPTLGLRSYRTPVDGLYLCSASTPPGGGVHGMGGRNAALAVLGAELR